MNKINICLIEYNFIKKIANILSCITNYNFFYSDWMMILIVQKFTKIKILIVQIFLT